MNRDFFLSSPQGLTPSAKPKKKRAISGWLLLDKPTFITSTAALAKIKWLFKAEKAGHAGTLDPLASGLLPIALGEATKIVPFVMDGTKTYEFTIAFGSETSTDDLEGEITRTSQKRPKKAEIEVLLAKFTGQILQTPPKFSAIKVNGQRAYDLARDTKEFHLEPRPVHIYNFDLLDYQTGDLAKFRVCCSKGTYIRALARDLGQALGCYAHISTLRRLFINAFLPEHYNKFVSLEHLISHEENVKQGDFSQIDRFLLPIETPLYHLNAYQINAFAAQKIQKGQKISLMHNEIIFLGKKLNLAPSQTLMIPEKKNTETDKLIQLFYEDKLLAIGTCEDSLFQPKRVFPLI